MVVRRLEFSTAWIAWTDEYRGKLIRGPLVMLLVDLSLSMSNQGFLYTQ